MPLTHSDFTQRVSSRKQDPCICRPAHRQVRCRRRSTKADRLLDFGTPLVPQRSTTPQHVDLDLVGEATSTQDAINLVIDLRPDVVVIDPKVPGTPGVQAIEQLHLLAPATRILILTRTEQNQVVEAIIAGASGYILKTAPTDTILAAIRATAAGGSAISPEIAGRLLEHIRAHDVPASTTDHGAGAIRGALTPRELEIFTKLASGKSKQEIGCELSLSTNTISNHIASILTKLHLENRIQAAVQAVRSGIS